MDITFSMLSPCLINRLIGDNDWGGEGVATGRR